MSESTIRIPHKIGSESELAATCAALLKEGVLFEATDEGREYVIVLKGY
jgi:hypothetical protein